MKFRCRYEYKKDVGWPEHIWSIVGPLGAIHFHVSENPKKSEHEANRYSGGIELHYRSPPDYMKDQAPHENCWLLKNACWHDGSSLQATEWWIPRWRADPHNHDAMFELLQNEYVGRFEGGEKP